MCPVCKVVQARPLHESDLQGDAKAEIYKSHCKQCNSKRDYFVPKPEDVPEPLRGLSAEALRALSLFDVDVGPENRAPDGYRKKTRMIRFLWPEQTVLTKIKSIRDKQITKSSKIRGGYQLTYG